MPERPVIALCLGVACAAAWAEGPDTTLADCRDRIGAVYRSGLPMTPTLFELCFGFEDAPPRYEWMRDVTLGARAGLATVWDVEQLLDAHLAPPPPALLDAARLSDILGDLALVEAQRASTLRDRFLDWLRARLPEADEDSFWRRVEEFLETSGWVARASDILGRVLTVAVLMAALFVVGNELRLAGPRFRARAASAGRGTAAPPAAVAPRPVSLEEIAALPPARRPAALLRLAIARLHAHRWLPPPRARTNRELLRDLDALAPGLADRFARLVAGAEPCIYGGRIPVHPALGALEAETRVLIENAADR
jgi:hypothetical protein